MVVSNRNLPFQRSIFRGKPLVSGSVCFVYKACLTYLASFNFHKPLFGKLSCFYLLTCLFVFGGGIKTNYPSFNSNSLSGTHVSKTQMLHMTLEYLPTFTLNVHPPKINESNLNMMVWFRWILLFNRVNCLVPAVNLPGCKPFMAW